ncbi:MULTISPECIES: alpha/beta fold hydrolase [unclassified Novosphingobium]|uniref:alpha/beta fold hydrolase n=1 Tax=unclassified Novosphingobium TaxID=2644732 RepID=UPI00135B9CA2|nr:MULTISPECIES: alpha/beta hydrolase [unclassified Novosphingobium]
MTSTPYLSRRTLIGAAAALPLAAPMLASTARAAPVEPQGPWTQSGFVERGGGRLAWRALGPKDGAPVVLLHKLGGWAADWRGVAPLLGDKRRVIAFDLPGHGDSAMATPPPYVQTVPETAAMLLAALDELGIERASFAGNSLGGVVSTEIAALWPQRVDKLVLASVSLFSGYDRAALAELEKKRDAKVYTADWRPVPRAREGGAAGFGTLVPSVDVEQDASRARADRWIRPSERGVGLLNTQAALGRTIAPLLFVYGDRGHYVKYVETGKAMRHDAQIVQLAETGSFVHQERPVEVAAAMRAFLDADA